MAKKNKKFKHKWPKGWRQGAFKVGTDHPSVVRDRNPIIRTVLEKGMVKGHTHAVFKAHPGCCPLCKKHNGRRQRLHTVIGWAYPLPHPNCYTEGTEVYTDRGWLPFEDLNGSEMVFTLNGYTQEAEFMKPVDWVEYHYTGDVVRFHNRFFDLETTPDHMHYVQRQRQPWSLVQAAVLPETGFRFYRGLNWEGTPVDRIQIGDNYLDSDTYCWLMAAYLAEGSVSPYQGCLQATISQSLHANPDTYSEMEFMLSTTPWKWWGGEQGFTTRDQEITSYLTEFGRCANDKFIPDNIRSLPKDNIATFLDVFCECDGNTRSGIGNLGFETTESSYFTTSKRMADVLGELVMKVGGRPSFGVHTRAGREQEFSNGIYTQNHDVLRVGHRHHVHTNKFHRTTRHYDGPVRCVEMPEHHIILVRRNGQPVWSGNCMCSWVTEGSVRKGDQQSEVIHVFRKGGPPVGKAGLQKVKPAVGGGKRDTSKLTKKTITNKAGKKQVVWVRTGKPEKKGKPGPVQEVVPDKPKKPATADEKDIADKASEALASWSKKVSASAKGILNNIVQALRGIKPGAKPVQAGDVEVERHKDGKTFKIGGLVVHGFRTASLLMMGLEKAGASIGQMGSGSLAAGKEMSQGGQATRDIQTVGAKVVETGTKVATKVQEHKDKVERRKQAKKRAEEKARKAKEKADKDNEKASKKAKPEPEKIPESDSSAKKKTAEKARLDKPEPEPKKSVKKIVKPKKKAEPEPEKKVEEKPKRKVAKKAKPEPEKVEDKPKPKPKSKKPAKKRAYEEKADEKKAARKRAVKVVKEPEPAKKTKSKAKKSKAGKS